MLHRLVIPDAIEEKNRKPAFERKSVNDSTTTRVMFPRHGCVYLSTSTHLVPDPTSMSDQELKRRNTGSN